MALRTLKGQFEFWSEQQPAINFIAVVLEWFSITVEVFLRRDFGERYFNRSKVMAGFFVLALWSFLRKMGSNFDRPSMGFFPGAEPPPEPSSFSFGGLVFTLIILLYVVLCGYHSFSIWWRNSTGRPLHSWDAGNSWLTPIGQLVMRAVNKLVGLFCRIFVITLPPDERASLMQSPPPAMNDAVMFTERYIEPLTVFVLSFVCMACDAVALGSWLLFSTGGLMFWTGIRHEKEREEMLDMRDSLIKSRYMTEAIVNGETDGLRIKGNVREVVQQMAIQAEAVPETMEQLRQGAPSLANAMEALNPKLRNLATTTPPESTVKENTVVKEEPPQPVPPPALANAMEALNPKLRNLATSTPPESTVKEITVVKEEPLPTPPPTEEGHPPVRSMPLRQSEYSVKETILVKEEPPQPAPAPPPVFTAVEESPPVAPEQRPIQNWEQSRENTSADTVKRLKILLIVAGLAIVGLVLFFVVSSVLKKSDAPVKEPEKTEILKPLPSPSPPVSTPPSTPLPTKKLKGEIQTEGGGIVNMRDQPSEEGAVVLPIPTGDEVTILRYGEDTALKNGEQGRWCRIAYKAQLGWVWGKYVKENE